MGYNNFQQLVAGLGKMGTDNLIFRDEGHDDNRDRALIAEANTSFALNAGGFSSRYTENLSSTANQSNNSALRIPADGREIEFQNFEGDPRAAAIIGLVKTKFPDISDQAAGALASALINNGAYTNIK
jgi:hypothetical protein